MAKVGVVREREDETRVAITPDMVKKLLTLGFTATIQKGAGVTASCPDADYEAAGASIAPDAAAALADADVVLGVRALPVEALDALKPGAMVVAMMNPYGERTALDALAQSGATGFSMEFVPRITRAQSMDVLSSQANLAGYRAIIEAAEAYGRALPMMMTAAGTVAAAKVFVMGAGVAGLQAIATARRLGAVVTATDVRPASKEQVESLGAKFVAVEDEEFKAAETAAGYAKPMSAEYQAKQASLVSEHIKKQDIVVTTALVPGRAAPRLVSAEQANSMKPGSVIVDLAVDQGGNCALSQPGETVTSERGVKIVGLRNLPGRVAADASALYARNLVNFLTLLVKDGQLAPDFDDEVVKGALVTRDGAVVHSALQSAA